MDYEVKLQHKKGSKMIVVVSMRKFILLGFAGIIILRAIPVVRWEVEFNPVILLSIQLLFLYATSLHTILRLVKCIDFNPKL